MFNKITVDLFYNGKAYFLHYLFVFELIDWKLNLFFLGVF
jgi:hypothetical protein